MTPAEQLAAARERVVGPYLPAREEWLMGWVGPCSPDNCDDSDVAICDGQIVDDRWVGAPSGIRLNVHRPEVRDHLVRLGCPEWARDVPAAVWCWGAGVEVADVITSWSDASDLAALNAGCILRVEGGWLVPLPDGGIGFFEEVNRDE